MRKRGRSRLSSAAKRSTRYKRKYSVDPACMRYKVLLPVMYPQLEEALINWDILELSSFPQFAACGVSKADEPYYLAWVKRKAELGLRFDDETRKAEYDLLKKEFEARGLDPVKLDCVEEIPDDWVRGLRGETFEENMAVMYWVPELGQWEKVGDEPWLITDDGDTSCIRTQGSWGQEDRYYKFKPTTQKKVTKLELHIIARAEGPGIPNANLYLWVGDHYEGVDTLGPPETGYMEYTFDAFVWIGKFLHEVLDTPEKVNATRLRIVGISGPYIRITQAHLNLNHASPKKPKPPKKKKPP